VKLRWRFSPPFVAGLTRAASAPVEAGTEPEFREGREEPWLDRACSTWCRRDALRGWRSSDVGVARCRLSFYAV
jgi:hypothetical protein